MAKRCRRGLRLWTMAIGVGLGFWHLPAEAQSVREQISPDTHTANVQVNALNLIFGSVTASADFRMMKGLGLGPLAGFATASSGGVLLSGLQIALRARITPLGDVWDDGWYLAPMLGYTRAGVRQGTASGNGGGATLGALAGYQWIWPKGPSLALGAGATYYGLGSTIPAENGQPLPVPTLHGVVPAVELSFGWLI